MYTLDGKTGTLDGVVTVFWPGPSWWASRGEGLDILMNSCSGRRPKQSDIDRSKPSPQDHYKPAILPQISTHRRQHKPPLRGGRVTAVTRRPQARPAHTQMNGTTRFGDRDCGYKHNQTEQIKCSYSLCAAFVLAGCARFTQLHNTQRSTSAMLTSATPVWFRRLTRSCLCSKPGRDTNARLQCMLQCRCSHRLALTTVHDAGTKEKTTCSFRR